MGGPNPCAGGTILSILVGRLGGGFARAAGRAEKIGLSGDNSKNNQITSARKKFAGLVREQF